MWEEQEEADIPFVSARDLAEIKKTNCEKDYAVIGELAQLMPDVRDQLLYSRSARDLIHLAKEYSDILFEVAEQRPLLKEICKGREILEAALDAERRIFIHTNEKRLAIYMNASKKWYKVWFDVQIEISKCSLLEAHEIIMQRAEQFLPFNPIEELIQ
ncbi:MAG: hypothetical protein AB1567_00335 [bacterium]